MMERLTASRMGTAGALCALAVTALAVPALSPVALVAGGALAWRRHRRISAYPLRVPRQMAAADPTERHPATGAPTEGRGTMLVGHETGTGREVWVTESDARQHFAVFGTAGSGMTESLLGFAVNALSWGSGFTWIDGRGDVALYARAHAIARRFGREDDLLVLNFMTGNEDVGEIGGRRGWSHRMNPFLRGSSDGLTQLVVSMLDDCGGDGAMWKGRATAMLTGVMRARCHLRDEAGEPLSPGDLRNALNLKAIIALSEDERLPQHVRKSILAYLGSLPGYQAGRGERQSQTTLDQHCYLEVQFTKILGSLADVYGHIFTDDGVDVDMYDVVLNRRILVVLLPALERSGDEVANLGRVVLATLKGMMGGILGSRLDGGWADVVENRPTRASSPYLVVLSDVGYYMVEGMALMAAQARSLGFSMVYASQDIPAMKRLNEKEAASIVANTNTKIFMRTEDPETAKSLIAGVRDKASLFDLKSQTEGEAHVASQDRLVRTRLFYPFAGWSWSGERIVMPELSSLGNAATKSREESPDEAVPDEAVPAMKRLSDQEAATIFANVNTKIFMRTDGESNPGTREEKPE